MGAPGCVRSSAYTVLGQGVTMYMVLFTTMGAASRPRSVPVENVHASFRFCTLPVLIWSSPLNRVLARSFAGLTHWPSSGSILPVYGRPSKFFSWAGYCASAAWLRELLHPVRSATPNSAIRPLQMSLLCGSVPVRLPSKDFGQLSIRLLLLLRTKPICGRGCTLHN